MQRDVESCTILAWASAIQGTNSSTKQGRFCAERCGVMHYLGLGIGYPGHKQFHKTGPILCREMWSHALSWLGHRLSRAQTVPQNRADSVQRDVESCTILAGASAIQGTSSSTKQGRFCAERCGVMHYLGLGIGYPGHKQFHKTGPILCRVMWSHALSWLGHRLSRAQTVPQNRADSVQRDVESCTILAWASAIQGTSSSTKQGRFCAERCGVMHYLGLGIGYQGHKQFHKTGPILCREMWSLALSWLGHRLSRAQTVPQNRADSVKRDVESCTILAWASAIQGTNSSTKQGRFCAERCGVMHYLGLGIGYPGHKQFHKAGPILCREMWSHALSRLGHRLSRAQTVPQNRADSVQRDVESCTILAWASAIQGTNCSTKQGRFCAERCGVMHYLGWGIGYPGHKQFHKAGPILCREMWSHVLSWLGHRLSRAQTVPQNRCMVPSRQCEKQQSITEAPTSPYHSYLSLPLYTCPYHSVPVHTSSYLFIPLHTSPYLDKPLLSRQHMHARKTCLNQINLSLPRQLVQTSITFITWTTCI